MFSQSLLNFVLKESKKKLSQRAEMAERINFHTVKMILKDIINQLRIIPLTACVLFCF